MIRSGKLQNVDELVTPGQVSGRTEQSPDKFVDGESIEDLEESPERVIPSRKVTKKMKTRNNVFEKTD